MDYYNIAENILELYVKKVKNISTQDVKEFFTDLAEIIEGDKDRREVYPYGKKGESKYKREYGYDLCWEIVDDDWEFSNPYYRELVLESEWSSDWKDIAEDFGKIIDSKSPLKVGICKYNKGLLEKIQILIKNYDIKIPNKEYYIIFLHNPTSELATGYLLDSYGNIINKCVHDAKP